MTSYAELSTKPKRFLALTGYTDEEFTALLPYFSAAFAAHMEKYTVTGKPRRARRYSTYKNSPLPSIEDKLLFILLYVKQAATQELHGEVFGMTQSVVNQWVHLLKPVLNQALAQTGDPLPVRPRRLCGTQLQMTKSHCTSTMAPSGPYLVPATRSNSGSIQW